MYAITYHKRGQTFQFFLSIRDLIIVAESNTGQIYEDIFANKSKGARIRSRAQWWEEGEKSSKYFFGLEKRKAREKSWSKI